MVLPYGGRVGRRLFFLFLVERLREEIQQISSFRKEWAFFVERILDRGNCFLNKTDKAPVSNFDTGALCFKDFRYLMSEGKTPFCIKTEF